MKDGNIITAVFGLNLAFLQPEKYFKIKSKYEIIEKLVISSMCVFACCLANLIHSDFWLVKFELLLSVV